MATPSYTRGQVESVVQVPDIDDSCRQLMRELDASMLDFANLLRTEPSTPSPMRDLIGTVAVSSPPPEAVVPSHQLFSRYLSPVTSPEGTYSDKPDVDMVVEQSMTLVNDCDGMTLVVGLPLTDKSKGSSWNALSLLMDSLGSDRRSFLLKSIGALIGLLVTGTLV
jgi:hypothetical protein